LLLATQPLCLRVSRSMMVDPKDASHVLGDVDLCWSRMGIAALESIGELA
jgi:hypothetical protein